MCITFSGVISQDILELFFNIILNSIQNAEFHYTFTHVEYLCFAHIQLIILSHSPPLEY